MTVMAARQAYGLLAANYDREPNALISLEERTMLPLLHDVRGCKVIDAGGGTGRWASHCSARGASAIAVDFCREMLHRSPVSAIEADCRFLPLRNAYADLAICAFTLGYAPGIFRELRRIVKPGGRIVVSDLHPEAVRRGWTRSFRHDGGVIAVANETYSFKDLNAPDLALSRLLEPRLGDPERKVFEQAGCPERFDTASQLPAIFIAEWVRL